MPLQPKLYMELNYLKFERGPSKEHTSEIIWKLSVDLGEETVCKLLGSEKTKVAQAVSHKKLLAKYLHRKIQRPNMCY